MKLSKVALSIRDSFLGNEYFRFLYTRSRYLFLKGRMLILNGFEGHSVVAHNMNFSPSAFGCGGRMAMLLYPLRGFLFPNHKTAKVLIVGPRTEDDIFWARSIGLYQARGLDLFTYSPLVDLGDACQTSYADHAFDAIILSWILPYIPDPKLLLSEMSRITKTGGIIGLGWHYVSDISQYNNEHGVQYLNTRTNVENLIAEIGGNVFSAFHSGKAETDHHIAVFFKVTEK